MIVGGLGRDLLVGGHGMDIFKFNQGDGVDWIRNFELGVDKIDISDFDFATFAELAPLIRDYSGRANVRLDGVDDLIRFIGIQSNQLTEGDFIFNQLGSGTGNTLTGNDEANKLYGSGAADVIRGEGGDDKLAGGSNDDQLFGGAGRDVIYANSGSDLIVGGEDKDVLVGGAGVDTFQFNRGDGFDTIKNFELGVDKVDISDFGFANFAELELLFRDYNGRANIRLDGTDDLVRFIGVTSDQLTEDDFIL